MRPLALLALALVPPDGAAAQDAGGAAPIVVIAGELPLPPGMPAYGSVTIGRERLTSGASGLVESVLADVAGFQQFRRSDSRSANPSAQGATLRALGGNASSRTLVLLDGVPQADPFFGTIPFTALVPEWLGAVRVTRGGGSGAFGAGAVAGTIELFSARRHDMPLLSGSADYGSRDSARLSATLAPDVGTGFVALSGRWERSDGFWTTPRDQRVAASVPARYESWSAALRGVTPMGDDLALQASLRLFRDDRTLRFRGADSRSEGQDASVRIVGGSRWRVDALAYVQARDFGNVVVSATSFRPTLDQRKTPSTGLGGKIELRPPLGEAHVLRLGGDARLATGTLQEETLSPATGAVTTRRRAGGRTLTAGLYVEDDWTLGRLVLTGGVRVDRWAIRDGSRTERNGAGVLTGDLRFADRAGWETTARGGALYRIGEGAALRVAGYAGFRLPTLNELYRPFVVFPVTTRANAALAPERLRGVEGGADLAPFRGAHLGVTVFWNRLGNAIANVTTGPSLRERRNVDAIVARGVELTGDWSLGDWRLGASYADAHSRVRAPGPLDGRRPAQSPAQTASATLSYLPRTGPGASLTLRHVGRQYEDDLETDALPAATTLDGVVRWRFASGFSVAARIENALDERIVTRNAGGSIDLGTPRVLWLSLGWER
jgi:iron complex outermembrane receptor protein